MLAVQSPYRLNFNGQHVQEYWSHWNLVDLYISEAHRTFSFGDTNEEQQIRKEISKDINNTTITTRLRFTKQRGELLLTILPKHPLRGTTAPVHFKATLQSK